MPGILNTSQNGKESVRLKRKKAPVKSIRLRRRAGAPTAAQRLAKAASEHHMNDKNQPSHPLYAGEPHEGGIPLVGGSVDDLAQRPDIPSVMPVLPVRDIGLAAVMLGEKLQWQHYVGGILIVTGALILAWT